MSLLSFRSVCINVLLNSGIGAEFFMTCTFGIGMLYSDISLFTYVQIVVYFLKGTHLSKLLIFNDFFVMTFSKQKFILDFKSAIIFM